ncbi:MAG: UDP-N-acetylmuramate--L-alanine ligase [Clostridia bacterium]|nr:UDP-N-acetylmuramate--L-alanine ligase [Clostridia bacterium]
MVNIDNLRKYNRIHMIGIGGTSMSGIASILKKWGFYVDGSDTSSSHITDRLMEEGIPVTIGHDTDAVNKADLVVYSAAIKETDVELIRANELGIPAVERKIILGEITQAFRNTICISGTHGKTTTTSMVSMCFLEANLDPTIQVGAELNAINGNDRVGNSDYFVLESCEYSESFLSFHPKAEIILNVDNDHLDYYKSIDNIKEAFIKYIKLLPDDGVLVYNSDDPNCSNFFKHTKAKSLTFGIDSSNANYVAKNITFDKNGFASFDVYHNNVFYKSFKLSVPGKHNVYNALACIALCDEFGIDKSDIKSALQKYTGASRRFEYLGEINGAKVFDDYGHHPTEITAVANAMKKKKYNHSWVIFQPHTYSRTKSLLNDFAKCLTNFDNIIVTDIYAAREVNTYGISSKQIVDKIERSGRRAYYISDFDDIIEFVKRNAKPDDIIITQGAGTITNLGHDLVKK